MFARNRKPEIGTAEDRQFLTGIERTFDTNEMIVSKTDTRGIMTYVNETFIKVSGYSEEEMIGRPHSIIRHPDMPRCVFKLLWDTLSQGEEIFAYVINRAKCGDHYWVFAHVTPTFDIRNEKNIIGYHSSRRSPKPEAVKKIIPIYQALLAEEKKHSLGQQIEASTKLLTDTLAQKGIDYSQFVFGL